MRVRIVVWCVAAAAVVGLVLSGAPANGQTVAQTKPKAGPLAAASKRTPSAVSAARVVKTGEGTYASVPLPRPAPRQTQSAPPAPVAVPPEAAQAFASAAAQVRVVTAEELNDIDRAADVRPMASVHAASNDGKAVQMVNAVELNTIDRRADATVGQAPRDTPPQSGAWVARVWQALGRAYAVLSAMARILVS